MNSTAERPGLNLVRLSRLVQEAVERCRLDLRDMVVLTEGATGAYVVTPVIAAVAGARRVYAMTESSPYGTVGEVTERTLELAGLCSVAEKIEIVTDKSAEIVGQADIVTNSGHLRPIDAEMIAWMKPTAVIPLMYEAWEFRHGDVDLHACRDRGITVAGTNERHPDVDVFSFLGLMAVKLLLDGGISIYGNRILLLCDNDFASFICTGLSGAGASVDRTDNLLSVSAEAPYDAILVAMTPQDGPVISPREAAVISRNWPAVIVAQYWGDVDRAALARAGVPYWPIEAPAAGHMGVLPADVGPEPIIRLQSGGLKVGEILSRSRRKDQTASEALAILQASGYGNAQDHTTSNRGRSRETPTTE